MRAYRRLFAVGLLACLSAAAQDLADPDPKVRVKAARALAKNGSESIPRLLPLLKDATIDVRREAVRSIVAIGTHHSVDPLIQATRDNDPEVQARAVDGLVNFYLPGYVDTGSLQRLTSAVKRQFDRENTQVIEPYVAVRPEVIRAIAPLVKGGASMESRAGAARALGILRGQAALPDLLDALRIKDDAVIFESLIAIQKIRDVSAGPRIMFLLGDLAERVQVAAIETVGLLKTTDAVPDLKRVYGNSKSEKVRAKALGSLAMIADPSVKVLYQNGLTDKSDSVRASALEGFARLKDPGTKDSIERTFNSEKKMAPRLAAAFALVALGRTETSELSPLTYLVNSLTSRSYRDVARPYLTELAREAPVRNALYAYLKTGVRDEKIGIARVLAVSGDKQSLAALDALTKDSDVEVAQEAIRALRSLQARLG
ncbi:MAG: HEAT repeat domain-containing protein [Bryobacteraceae bacterium]|nr:HEAT repeat domain-containing protein [Bryobacteraceae bacterium]